MSQHRHFCTYFDHRYLTRGLALLASLEATVPAFTLWVLALSDETVQLLSGLALPNVRIVPLPLLLLHDPELAATRRTRSPAEFYFTCSPCLPRYLMQREGITDVTYLDSDLFFLSTPEPVFEEIRHASIAITPHRFAGRAIRTHSRYGRYNVGWVTFRNDENGMACLEWWRQRCLEWCFDRAEAERYADQKYLDQFETLFSGVQAIRHPGANVAPWNVAGLDISLRDGRVLVDGRELVFFHFQGLRRLSRRWYDSNLTGYGARLDPILRQHAFRPYLQALLAAETRIRMIDAGTAMEIGPGVRRRPGLAGVRAALGRTLRTLRAGARGNLIRL